MKKFTNGKLVEMNAQEIARFNAMRNRALSRKSTETNERINKLEEQIAVLLAAQKASETGAVKQNETDS